MQIKLHDGTARAVYSDQFRPLFEVLGTMQVSRASDVDYYPTTGEWVAVLRSTGDIIARGRNREEVIKAEVAYIDARL